MVINIDRYNIILSLISRYFATEEKDLYLFLKKKDNKYLFLLLLKQFNCLDKKKIKEYLSVKSDKTIDNNIKKAEEKLLINAQFRKGYFDLEDRIEKNI